MIKNVFIDGVQVNDERTFLSKVNDSVAAQTELNSYSRGGRSGVALGNPFYRGFVLALEWTIIGRTQAELLQKRDRLAKFFRIKPNKAVAQTKTLAFEMIDGSVRQIPAIFSPYVGSISPEDTTKSVIQVTCQTEQEYFVSRDLIVSTVRTINLGGFEVPFDVPLNVAHDPVGEPTTISNSGNSEFFPLIRLYAPLNIATLINETTGKELEYAGELTDDDILELDFYNQTAVLNNNINALADITGEWWYLEPGDNIIRLVAGSGDGFAEVEHRHAYRGV